MGRPTHPGIGFHYHKIKFKTVKASVEFALPVYKTRCENRILLIEKQISDNRRGLDFARNYPFGKGQGTIIGSANIITSEDAHWYTTSPNREYSDKKRCYVNVSQQLRDLRELLMGQHVSTGIL